MANTFIGLSIAKSGLYAYQAAMNTAAHNASNAKTPGYTRQTVVQNASTPLSIYNAYGMQGTGVDVAGVEQIRDEYYDTKFWKNKGIFGNYDTKSYYLNNIQGYYSEVSSDGATAALDRIFTSLNGLSTNVGDLTIRTQAAENANTLTDTVNAIYNNLQTLQKECNDEIKNTADQINSIAQRISSLTLQINTIEVTGANANDLRDARNLLVDELSGLANTTVEEKAVGDDIGVNQYIVRLDGKTLVDTYSYNTLKATPEETSVNQNDVGGLYTLSWSDGQSFNPRSESLGGKLQALFEMRDGNNKVNFTGNTTAATGDTSITVTGSNINSEILLNIPATDGTIMVGNQSYKYDSFTTTVNADGSYSYTFSLASPLKSDVSNEAVNVGDSVDYKGIPYYQAQLNEFTRTLAKAFNDIHTQGEDLNGNRGLDFFTATTVTSGKEFSFSSATTGFGSVPDETLTDANGYVKTSYYSMTAGNIKITQAITDDPKKLACAKYDTTTDSGVEDKTILDKLIALKNDMDMYKQGPPDMFLQTMVAEMALDAKSATTFATGQENVLKVITSQRSSVSGVDSDEEAVNLTKYKNAYNLCSKVISVMNEVYDRLINSTGV
ncbi:MAG: flagellar hook-associated protein 1 [Clostridiales bacterium]|nr:flagellar hook-associated protein 1 [Clostridiales bacterium]